jgi:hypothetical protein
VFRRLSATLLSRTCALLSLSDAFFETLVEGHLEVLPATRDALECSTPCFDRPIPSTAHHSRHLLALQGTVSHMLRISLSQVGF